MTFNLVLKLVFEVAFLFHLIMFNVLFWPCVESVSHQISWRYVLINCVCHYHWFDVLDLQATSLLQNTLSYWSTLNLWSTISSAQWKNMGCHWHHCENFVMLVMNQHVLNQSKRHWLFHDALHLTITLDNQCQNAIELRGLKYNLIFLCN